MSPTDSCFVVATDSTSSVFPATKEDRAFVLGAELRGTLCVLGNRNQMKGTSRDEKTHS